MLGSYVSLDPTYATEKTQVKTDRERVYQHRLKEARGGDGADMMGFISGVTGGYWTYMFLANRGMTLLPFQTKNLTSYALVFGAFFFSYIAGHGIVAG